MQYVSSTTGRPISSGASAKQSWQAGDTVNVGFVRGLEVVKRIPTPGDFAPDAYALWQPATGRFYRFVPHTTACSAATAWLTRWRPELPQFRAGSATR